VPELPDVEIYRRTLARTSLHREVRTVQVLDGTMLDGVGARALRDRLRGRTLQATRRHGKHLVVDVSDGGVLVLHFGMTGRLATGTDEEPDDDHTRVVVRFVDGWLALVDQRRLGRVSMADDLASYVSRERLGPDAMSLSVAELRGRVRGSRGGIKATLMDQARIAGLGNIYTDEVLFQARIDPVAPAPTLDDAAVRRLHRQLHRVVDLAVERHADPTRVPRSWLLPRREDGRPCPRGNGTVRAHRVGGRTAYWCPECQRG